MKLILNVSIINWRQHDNLRILKTIDSKLQKWFIQIFMNIAIDVRLSRFNLYLYFKKIYIDKAIKIVMNDIPIKWSSLNFKIISSTICEILNLLQISNILFGCNFIQIWAGFWKTNLCKCVNIFVYISCLHLYDEHINARIISPQGGPTLSW